MRNLLYFSYFIYVWFVILPCVVSWLLFIQRNVFVWVVIISALFFLIGIVIIVWRCIIISELFWYSHCHLLQNGLIIKIVIFIWVIIELAWILNIWALIVFIFWTLFFIKSFSLPWVRIFWLFFAIIIPACFIVISCVYWLYSRLL